MDLVHAMELLLSDLVLIGKCVCLCLAGGEVYVYIYDDDDDDT